MEAYFIHILPPQSGTQLTCHLAEEAAAIAAEQITKATSFRL